MSVNKHRKQNKYVFVPNDREVVTYDELVKLFDGAGTAKELLREMPGTTWSTLYRHLVRAGADVSRFKNGGRTGQPSRLARLESANHRLTEENLTLRARLKEMEEPS